MIQFLSTYGFLIVEILYFLIVLAVCARIIYDTRSNTKTLAYLLLVIFVPIAGIVVYFTFGINYRKNKLYSKKLVEDENQLLEIVQLIKTRSNEVLDLNNQHVPRSLAELVLNDNISPLTHGNKVSLLHNGEEKFPALFQAIRQAKNHIHIEYYIIEDDELTREFEQLLYEKAKEGVKIRIIYDDFGSSSIRKTWAKRLKANGIEIAPFYKIKFMFLANRMNYRNHRKIVVIDGFHGFVGGINLCKRYDNRYENAKYWRDSHLEIEGPGVFYLQNLFMADWRFCVNENLEITEDYFPIKRLKQQPLGDHLVQIVASGPDSDFPTILYSLLQGIHLAQEEILITTPYFIPSESLMDSLIVAALGGIKIKLIVPGLSDSLLVNAAAFSFYGELLRAGVEVHLYNKGFVHAKSVVIDRKIAMLGTANIDNRSFDLNFEVNALVYDQKIATELASHFDNDLLDCEKIDPIQWKQRPKIKQLTEKVVRLVAPLL